MSSLSRKMLKLKTINLSKIGEVALTRCLNDCKFKDLLSFENIEERYGRTLNAKKIDVMKYRYCGYHISTSTNTEPQFSELLFVKEYFSNINTNDHTIINSIIKFFSNDFINRFYDEVKKEILTTLDIHSDSFSIDLMKAIPPHKIAILECTERTLQYNLEFLSNTNSLMVPFISFVDKNSVGKEIMMEDDDHKISTIPLRSNDIDKLMIRRNGPAKGCGCITVFPTSKVFYRGYRTYDIDEVRLLNIGDLKSLSTYNEPLSLSTVGGKVKIIIGNLYNYLLIRIKDNETRESGFLYFNRNGESPKVLTNPLSIPYINSLLYNDTTLESRKDLKLAKDDYTSKKNELQNFINRYVEILVSKVCNECNELFKKDHSLQYNPDTFISGKVESIENYKMLDDYIELHDINSSNPTIEVCFVEYPKIVQWNIDINYNELISDSDDFKDTMVWGPRCNDQKVRSDIELYVLKIFKSNKDLFKRIYYKDHPELQTILTELSNLKAKVDSAVNDFNNDKHKLFENISFTDKDVDIQTKFTEMEYYTGSSDYGFKCISL